ncbi:glycoside hydrolase family 26 protein [Pseudarthrobacter sp. DSP2-3-2b1]|uniref:glycoside hydrolase family 26 protein n=1 Tax=Pseudarthrobacter sp. DSP2-3-2b1 TaxID=2804661 RepID=UPI003CF5A2F1
MNYPTRRSALLGIGLAAASVGVGASAATAAPAPAVSLTPAAGPPGSSVTLNGTGFPRSSAGTITGGSSPVAFQTGKNGTFSVVATIGLTAQGPVVLVAASGKMSATTTFSVLAGVPPVSSAFLRFGVATPGGAASGAELDAVAALVGESPGIVLSYKDFRQAPPVFELESVVQRGAMPLLTWEPWIAGAGVTQPAYALARITAGDFDPYISQWAAALASWGKPVMLRFAHEMNGDWYPWAEAVNGNSPGDYVQAWRHVHALVSAAGATNVNWVWAPNGGGSVENSALYPGDAYVDTVGLDAYNWGTTQVWSSWQLPVAVFGPHLAELRIIAPGKQIVITETASTETGGSKPEWNAALVSYLRTQPDVSGFVWFNLNKETDWRINSSAASASALSAALAARR